MGSVYQWTASGINEALRLFHKAKCSRREELLLKAYSEAAARISLGWRFDELWGKHHRGVSPRTESDTFGPIEVPADRLWGAQTERSRRNFRIGEERMPTPIIRALGLINGMADRIGHPDQYERQRGNRIPGERDAGGKAGAEDAGTP